MKGGWIYIVTNKTFGTLYTGVTNNLARRIGEHRGVLSKVSLLASPSPALSQSPLSPSRSAAPARPWRHVFSLPTK
jgi:hypothetical protein